MTAYFKLPAFNSAPVVALHSSASNCSQWKSLTVQLQDWHEVFAVDLPGYGNGPARDTSVEGMNSVSAPVLSEIERLDTPIHLVGHSFGGAVAIKIALMRPDLVKSLTLYEPAAFQILKTGTLKERQVLSKFRNVERSLNTSISNGRDDLGMETFINFWNGENTWKQLPEALRGKLTSVASVVSSDFQCCISETWALKDLADLSVPTLMMVGMDSPEVAQRTANLIAKNIPGAELAMLPGLGHMGPVQDPDWVNPRIRQHIARVANPSTHVSWPHRTAA